MRFFACSIAYIFGVILAFTAAITCSVGPEPARTQLGRVLAVVYRPYYDLFCEPFGTAGFLAALALSGVPFALLVWLVLRVTGIGNDY
jgi:hypothetical protein